MVFCLGSLGFGNPEGKTKINILLKKQSNTLPLRQEASWLPTRQEQREHVVETLKRQAFESQHDLLGLLEELRNHGLVSDIESYWLVNGISCMSNPSVIPQLEQRPEVMAVYRVEEAQWIHENEATPLVTGAIALMLSKNPRLTPEQIDEILERTAMPLSAHKSNDFGAGLLDALAAVNAFNDKH